VTSEVQKALELGYRLDQIYEVWHFPESSHDLFAAYINTFLKIKQEASGFPEDCNTPEQQQNYIQEILQREGIQMNPAEIQKNPVRRTIAKLSELFVGKIRPKITVTQNGIPNRRRGTPK
jgi:hypothetical protein